MLSAEVLFLLLSVSQQHLLQYIKKKEMRTRKDSYLSIKYPGIQMTFHFEGDKIIP